MFQNEDCVVNYTECQKEGDLCLEVNFTDGESEQMVLFSTNRESCIFKGAFKTEPKRSVTATSPDCSLMRSSSDLHVSQGVFLKKLAFFNDFCLGDFLPKSGSAGFERWGIMYQKQADDFSGRGPKFHNFQGTGFDIIQLSKPVPCIS